MSYPLPPEQREWWQWEQLLSLERRPPNRPKDCWSQEGLKQLSSSNSKIIMYVNPHFTKNKKLGKKYFDYHRAVRLGKERTTSLSRNVPKDGTPCSMHTQLVKNNIRPLGIKPDMGSCSRADFTPTQGGAPREYQLSQVLDNKLATKILTLLEKEAILKIPPPLGKGFLSRMFVVPKKVGNVRPIIDLTGL